MDSESCQTPLRFSTKSRTITILPASVEKRLLASIRDIPDFPRTGIIFKDIAPVLADGALFRDATEAMAAPFTGQGITHVVGIESRGFILGAPVAQTLGVGFLPMRKPGKLPYRTESEEYALEYGTDRLEIHVDACGEGARILVVDDVLATGGTASAAGRLARKLGADVVGMSFLVELTFLNGRERLREWPMRALVQY